MVLTSKEEFLSDFMKISKDLTSAELRMLYLIIKEPEVLNLPQEQFAIKIKVHRRTINIGLKKLRELNLISADPDNLQDEHDSEINYNNILKGDLVKSKKFVLMRLKEHYHRNPHDFVVNEDFFSRILGDYGLHKELQYNRDFIIETIKEIKPDCLFHSDLKMSSFDAIEHFYVISKINSEIQQERRKRRYYIDKNTLLQHFSENYSISEEEVRKVIKKNFPGLRIVKDRIRIKKPYRGQIQPV